MRPFTAQQIQARRLRAHRVVASIVRWRVQYAWRGMARDGTVMSRTARTSGTASRRCSSATIAASTATNRSARKAGGPQRMRGPRARPILSTPIQAVSSYRGAAGSARPPQAACGSAGGACSHVHAGQMPTRRIMCCHASKRRRDLDWRPKGAPGSKLREHGLFSLIGLFCAHLRFLL